VHRYGEAELLEVSLRYGRFTASRIRPRTCWEVGSFIIFPGWRGKGWARKLARHLPEHCRLEASPFDQDNGGLDFTQLVRFYERLGFRKEEGRSALYWMVRGAPPESRSRKRSKKPL
jgi:GNAT superfamily N-acetyltransferase